MKKQVFVINGPGGVGKDTLCAMAAQHFKVKNVSSITPIKEIATQCGWGGEKTDRARKFLADLKALTVEYNDYPTKWITKEYEDFLSSDEEIMFVHIREGAEIRKFVEATDGRAASFAYASSILFRSRIGCAGEISLRHPNTDVGVIEHNTTSIPFAFASSHIEMMLPSVFSGAMYPLFCATSFVPDRITTHRGFKSITSRRKRTNISDEVCPLIPRPTKLFFLKNSGSCEAQPSVIELPINTASGRVVTFSFASA